LDGIHVVANLYRCQSGARYSTDAALLRQFCIDAVKRSGLTIVGELFHGFDGGGVTGCVVLAESHLAIHTWPELQSVTLDVYVCNYTQDNSDKARQVADDLTELFRPEDVVRHEVPRDRQYLYEKLNEDYGYFLRSSKLIEQSRTDFQDLEIHQTPQFGKLFRLDGCFQTSEKDEFVYHETIVHPALTALAEPKRVLIIGGGDGGAAEEALKHPSVEKLTLVELDGRVVEIAREHFGEIHRGVFDDPRLELRIEDGLKFVAETDQRYDLVVLDLPDPVGPAEQLYEEAFFRDCKRVLNKGGVLTLHMGSPWSRPDRVRSLYTRLAKLFTFARPYTMFIPLYGAQWSMCACSDATDIAAVTPAEVDKRIAKRALPLLQYYNGAVHQALFALPNFVRDLTTGALPKPKLVTPRPRAAAGSK
jgi:spermidine synthase